MDPKACLARILEALEMRDYDEAYDALGDMLRWLRKGGAMPEMDNPEFDYLLDTLRDFVKVKAGR